MSRVSETESAFDTALWEAESEPERIRIALVQVAHSQALTADNLGRIADTLDAMYRLEGVK